MSFVLTPSLGRQPTDRSVLIIARKKMLRRLRIGKIGKEKRGPRNPELSSELTLWDDAVTYPNGCKKQSRTLENGDKESVILYPDGEAAWAEQQTSPSKGTTITGRTS